VEEMALFLTFSSISSLSFQKKRRRKGVEEGDSFLPLFSLFFLSPRRSKENYNPKSLEPNISRNVLKFCFSSSVLKTAKTIMGKEKK
jgi:hypothetical protein